VVKTAKINWGCGKVQKNWIAENSKTKLAQGASTSSKKVHQLHSKDDLNFSLTLVCSPCCLWLFWSFSFKLHIANALPNIAAPMQCLTNWSLVFPSKETGAVALTFRIKLGINFEAQDDFYFLSPDDFLQHWGNASQVDSWCFPFKETGAGTSTSNQCQLWNF